MSTSTFSFFCLSIYLRFEDGTQSFCFHSNHYWDLHIFFHLYTFSKNQLDSLVLSNLAVFRFLSFRISRRTQRSTVTLAIYLPFLALYFLFSTLDIFLAILQHPHLFSTFSSRSRIIFFLYSYGTFTATITMPFITPHFFSPSPSLSFLPSFLPSFLLHLLLRMTSV